MSREEALNYLQRQADDPLYGYLSSADLIASMNTVYDDMELPIPIIYDESTLPIPGEEGQMFYVLSTGEIVIWSHGRWTTNAQGEPGPPGEQGPIGPAGPEGIQGIPGPVGPVGLQGIQGAIGVPGPAGPQGNPGGGVTVRGGVTTANQPNVANVQPGDMYIVGAGGTTIIGGYTLPTPAVEGEGLVWTGATWTNVGPIRGPVGAPGPQGIQGTVGSVGAQGPTGPQGVAGSAGPQGIQGVTGPTGPGGLLGPTGPAGPQGSQGLGGGVGATGPIGPTGPAGSVGSVGATGATGPTGPVGQGLVLTGTSVAEPSNPVVNGIYLYNGNTLGYWGINTPAPITLQPNDLAIWNGTVWTNLGLVRGPVGLTGATGPVGPTGPIGITGLNGNTGQTGPVGPVGPQGPDGAVGPKGDKGDTGLRGPQGYQGPQGVTGQTGSQGPPGDTGPRGAEGPQGPPGIQGVKGDQGVPGPQGTAGNAGAVGAIGPTGPQGPIGITGSLGPAGPTGPQGKGMTITATLSSQSEVNSANATAREGDLYLVEVNGLVFPGIVNPPLPGDLVIKTGTGWQNLGPVSGVPGPVGPAGPTRVSGQAGNGAYIAADGLIYTPDVVNRQVIAGNGLQGGGTLSSNPILHVNPGPGVGISNGQVVVLFGSAGNTAARGDHAHTDLARRDGTGYAVGAPTFTGAVVIDQGPVSSLTLKGTSSTGTRIIFNSTADSGGASLVTVPNGLAVKDISFAGFKNLSIAAPTTNDHATTKKYVDDKIVAQAAQPTTPVEGMVWVQV